MRVLLFFFIVQLAFHELLAQRGIITDTLPTTLNLKNVDLGKKIIRAEYGKAVMYFSQMDYFKMELSEDTIIITPKYFDNSSIADLIKLGKTKIFKRYEESFQDSIRHRLKQYGSLANREFEFSDGVVFFSTIEIIGITDIFDFDHSNRNLKRIKKKKKNVVVWQKEFEYKEEFPVINDSAIIKVKDYFPQKVSAYYVYDLNNGYGETDTNQCRQFKLENQDVFYFAETYSQSPLYSIGTVMFGEGLYFYRADSLFTIKSDYEKEISEATISQAVLLLPAFMKAGDSITVAKDSHKDVFTFLQKEDLSIKGKIYKDCIKFKILTYWDSGTIYLSYIWLQKNIGLVKWMRSTGRVDELIDLFNK